MHLILNSCNVRTYSSFFSYFASRMSEVERPVYWVGGTLGGITLATVSAIVMWVAEKKIPNGKTIGRDVILGVVLFFLLLQLLPESTTMLITAIISFVNVSNKQIVDAVPKIPSLEEMEVRVGVPRF
jgi:hypothetical protein